MQHGFWIDRWREGKTAFHEGKPNGLLERHVDRLGTDRRVLVPLCGKAEDLAFLAARGHSVVGAELAEDAVRAFFDEHQITPVVTRRGEHVEYVAGPIRIFAGDFFTLTPALVGPSDAFYDRAALVALPLELRARYVSHLRSLVAGGSRGLVITFEYPEGQIAPPPYSIDDAEVRGYYEGALVDLIQTRPDPRALERGAPDAIEHCFAIQLPRNSQKSVS